MGCSQRICIDDYVILLQFVILVCLLNLVQFTWINGVTIGKTPV